MIRAYPQAATEIVHAHGALSYNSSSWEKLITGFHGHPAGHLLDLMGLDCPSSRLDELAFYVSNRLRAVFPQYTRSSAAWKCKVWTDEETWAILAIVESTVHDFLKGECAVDDLPLELGARSVLSIGVSELGYSFAPWIHFPERGSVSMRVDPKTGPLKVGDLGYNNPRRSHAQESIHRGTDRRDLEGVGGWHADERARPTARC